MREGESWRGIDSRPTWGKREEKGFCHNVFRLLVVLGDRLLLHHNLCLQ